MRQKPTAGYERRLAHALERGPRPSSVRGLALELGERFPNLRGTSYGGVRVYAEGRVANPRIELLRAIAEVLEVRREWLAFDVGAMTEEEEQARRGVGQGAADAIRDPDEAGMYEEIVERFPDLKLFDPDIPALFAMHCLRRVQALAQLGVDWSDDLLFEVAEDVWDDLWSPSQTWGLRLGRRVPLGRDEMSRQIRAMVPALDATILAVFPPGTTAADLEDWEPLDPEEDDDA